MGNEMTRTVTQNPKNPNPRDFGISAEKWDRCKPPYSGSHIQICVTAAKIILNHLAQHRSEERRVGKEC